MISEVTKNRYILSEEQKQRKSYLARIRYGNNYNRLKEKQAERRTKNRASYNKYRNEYRTKNPKGIFDVLKQSAKKRGLFVGFTREEFCKWYLAQKRICIYCQRTEENILLDDDIIQSIAKRLSIDRLQNSIGYLISNIGLCCRRCNTIKGNFFTAEEMFEIGKIINRKHADK